MAEGRTDPNATTTHGVAEGDVTDETPRNNGDPSPVQTDGGWGWLVCFTGMCANGIFTGTVSTFSILYVSLLDRFAGSEAEDVADISFKTSWIGSLMLGLAFLMSAVAGVASDRFGLRKVAFTGGFLAFIGMLSSAFVQDLMLLYLSYGVCIGVGFAFPYSLSVVILGHYFKRRLGLASGIVTSGGSVFGVAYSLFLPKLLGSVKHADDLFPDSDSNILPLCMSVMLGVCRLVFGLLADVRCLNPVHMQQAALLTFGITTICIPTAHSFPALVVIALVLGMCDGAVFSVNGPIVFSLVHQQDASQAFGFFIAMMSVPVTVGPPVAGLMYDYFGSYTIAFHVFGITPVLGAIIMLCIPRQRE
ncbi:hypothetical protein BaRGS_00038272, partial [Batillaria attramentaria]